MRLKIRVYVLTEFDRCVALIRSVAEHATKLVHLASSHALGLARIKSHALCPVQHLAIESHAMSAVP
jgi:hypothetical protein